MTGRTNYTPINNGDAPNFGPDITSVFEHFDPLVGESVDDSGDLPSSGNWEGRTILAEDTDILWVNTDGSTGWKPFAGLLPYCELGMSAAQNVSTASVGSGAKLSWDSEVSDPFAMHAGGSPSRITVPLKGRYLVRVRLRSTAATSTFFGGVLYVNGSALGYTETTQTPTANSTGNLILVDTLTLNANDYIEASGYGASAVALTTDKCRFSVQFLHPVA